MPSILLSVLIMAGLSVLTGFLTYKSSKRRRRAAIPLAAVAVVLLLLHATVWGDTLLLARLLPVRDVIVYGNIQPIAAAALAGVALALLRTPALQRTLLVAALAGVAAYRAWWPLFGDPPSLQPDRWTNGVCRQSSTLR